MRLAPTNYGRVERTSLPLNEMPPTESQATHPSAALRRADDCYVPRNAMSATVFQSRLRTGRQCMRRAAGKCGRTGEEREPKRNCLDRPRADWRRSGHTRRCCRLFHARVQLVQRYVNRTSAPRWVARRTTHEIATVRVVSETES
jgi:hypothetical protein